MCFVTKILLSFYLRFLTALGSKSNDYKLENLSKETKWQRGLIFEISSYSKLKKLCLFFHLGPKINFCCLKKANFVGW